MDSFQGRRGRSTLRSRRSRGMSALGLIVLLSVLGCGGGSSSPAAPQPPPEGAIFRVAVLDESFHILLQDPERIAEADALLVEGAPRKTVAGRVRRGNGGFNQPWSWHLVPESVGFPEVCAEIYDGRPSFVEGDVGYWADEVMYFCPWSGQLVARVR